MNLFLNPFLPEKTHTDDSVLFHVTPTPDHGPTWNLRSPRVRQSICLKGFKNGAGLVGNYLICWTQMQRLARASRLLTSSLLGQTTHLPRPSAVDIGQRLTASAPSTAFGGWVFQMNLRNGFEFRFKHQPRSSLLSRGPIMNPFIALSKRSVFKF